METHKLAQLFELTTAARATYPPLRSKIRHKERGREWEKERKRIRFARWRKAMCAMHGHSISVDAVARVRAHECRSETQNDVCALSARYLPVAAFVA